MKVKCEYCGAHIDRTAEKCENCGAVNLHQMRSGDSVPKTIEELLAFAKEKNLHSKICDSSSVRITGSRVPSEYTRIRLQATLWFTRINPTVRVPSGMKARMSLRGK